MVTALLHCPLHLHAECELLRVNRWRCPWRERAMGPATPGLSRMKSNSGSMGVKKARVEATFNDQQAEAKTPERKLRNSRDQARGEAGGRSGSSVRSAGQSSKPWVHTVPLAWAGGSRWTVQQQAMLGGSEGAPRQPLHSSSWNPKTSCTVLSLSPTKTTCPLPPVNPTFWGFVPRDCQRSLPSVACQRLRPSATSSARHMQPGTKPRPSL